VLKRLWPKFLAGKARAWVLERVAGGEVTGGKFTVNLGPEDVADAPADPRGRAAVRLDGRGMIVSFNLERNAEVVTMCSYAPLFAHAEGWQWTPDLIWFDNLNSYGTPNYYIQKLYANNKGTHVLSILSNNAPVTGQERVYASAVWDENTNELIIKVVNASDREQTKEIVLEGAAKVNSKATLIVLKSETLDGVNSISEPKKISPVEQPLSLKGKKLSLPLAPHSFSVVKIKLSK